jgi:hypothetical protein
VRASRGTTWIWHPARGVLVSRVVGVFTTQAATAVAMMMHRISNEDGFLWQSFHDWEGMTDYEDGTRLQLTEAGRMIHVKNTAPPPEGHFLVGAKTVAFGIHVASLSLKQVNLSIREHPTRASFNVALESALNHRRLGESCQSAR